MEGIIMKSLYYTMIFIQITLTGLFMRYWKKNRLNRCLKRLAVYLTTPKWVRMSCIWILFSFVSTPYWVGMSNYISWRVASMLLILAWLLYLYIIFFRKKVLGSKLIYFLLHFSWQLIIGYGLFLIFFANAIGEFTYYDEWCIVRINSKYGLELETASALSFVLIVPCTRLTAMFFSIPYILSLVIRK